MNGDGTFYICEACREVVTPEEPEVVEAVELLHTPTFDGKDQVVEGLGVFFHRDHYPVGTDRFRISLNPPIAAPGR